jgi:protein-disulfide isomerase
MPGLAVVSPRDHLLGPSTAALVLVQYGDYECPYTLRSNYDVAAVRRELGQDLLFVFRHFPLTEIHPHAQRAALAAESAADAGLFWPMHEALFAHQRDLSDPGLAKAAAAAGADPEGVLADVDGRAALSRVQADVTSGTAAGVQGTPTFFVNGVMHDGPYASETLVRALQRRRGDRQGSGLS